MVCGMVFSRLAAAGALDEATRGMPLRDAQNRLNKRRLGEIRKRARQDSNL